MLLLLNLLEKGRTKYGSLFDILENLHHLLSANNDLRFTGGC